MSGFMQQQYVKRGYRMLMVLMMSVLVLGALPGMVAASGSTPISEAKIVPILFTDGPGGNTTCDDVGDYMYSSNRFDEGDQYGGTAGPITWSTVDSTYVSWSGSHGGLAIILKGGNASNVYVYDGSYTSDSGLASPPNASGNPAGLSNITFCWNPGEVACEWNGETAWAAGTRYVKQGNWATYTAYAAGSTVTLYAGKSMEAGSVEFSAVQDGEVKITITLNDGWRFAAGEENVKIQDYASAPSGNPSPGLFDHKGEATDSSFSITVPANNFYGVHVDVEWQKCAS